MNNNHVKEKVEGHVTHATVSSMNQFGLVYYFLWGRGESLFSSKASSVLLTTRRGDLEETIYLTN